MKNFFFKLWVFFLLILAIPFVILSLLSLILLSFSSLITGLLCYRSMTDAMFHMVYVIGGSSRF